MTCEACQAHDEQVGCSSVEATAQFESLPMKRSSQQILFRVKSPFFLDLTFRSACPRSHDGAQELCKNTGVHRIPALWPPQDIW